MDERFSRIVRLPSQLGKLLNLAVYHEWRMSHRPRHQKYVSTHSEACARIVNNNVHVPNSMIRVGSIGLDVGSPRPCFRIKPQIQTEKSIKSGKERPDLYDPYIVLSEYTKDSVDGFPLNPGTVIKLGRVEFMVLEFRDEEEVFTLRDTIHINETNGTFEVKEKTIEEIEKQATQCKICLSDEETDKNPLIAPCRCKGSC